MYTFEQLHRIIDTHPEVYCYPYETAGVKFDDPFDYIGNTLEDSYGTQGSILQGRLARIAGVKPDNKTVYKIITGNHYDIYVQFWDGRTTVSDKMFIRNRRELISDLTYEMIRIVEKLENNMNISREESIDIIQGVKSWLVRYH